MNSILSSPEETKKPGISIIDEYNINIDNEVDIRSERLLLSLTKRIEHSELDINYLKVLYNFLS